MLLDIIVVLVIIFLMVGVCWSMWKLSKWLVIPIQIVLFILLLIAVVRIVFTPDNAERIKEAVRQSGVVELEQKSISGAAETFKKDTKNTEKEIK